MSCVNFSPPHHDPGESRLPHPLGHSPHGHVPAAVSFWLQSLDSYALPFRAWTATDRQAAKLVRRVGETHTSFVREIFGDLGFEGEDLEIRTRLFVTYFSLEPSLQTRITKAQRKANLQGLLALFCRPRSHHERAMPWPDGSWWRALHPQG
jgi:hypothetical protein